MIKTIEVCDRCGKKLRELGEVEIVREPPEEVLCTLCAEEKKLRRFVKVCPKCGSVEVRKVKDWGSDFSDWECRNCGGIGRSDLLK